MSLLDSVLGGLMGGQAQQSPVSGILSSLLGGGAAGGQPGAQAGGGMGGLTNLVSRFQQAGLGNVAQSWVSNDPNHPVTPQQLHQVFGEQQVNQWAQQTNMQPHDLLSQLAQFLPHAVDGVTPQGQLPQGGIQDGMQGQDPFSEPGVEVRR
ncbi:MAG: DUF937 domain-containing protein [Acetobacteraceae bacterium]|nr:DUF937 domain-containing protein [Acetobacteraceae bacterium]